MSEDLEKRVKKLEERMLAMYFLVPITVAIWMVLLLLFNEFN